jgi:hypothetical protein
MIMACIAMDKASLMYSLALARSCIFLCRAHISGVTLLGVILHPEFYERSKEANKQTNNNHDLCFWFGILAWDLDFGFWIGTSNASNLCGFSQT